MIFYIYVDRGALTISRILLIIYSNKNIEGVFMGKIFKNDVSVLFNNNPISEDFHLYECGYEECKPTKPYEFVPIDYWVIHYCIAGEGIFQIEDKQNHIKAGDIFMIPPYTKNKYYPLPENPWSYHWIGLRGKQIHKLLSMCGLSPETYIIHNELDTHLKNLFEKIYQEFQRERYFKSISTTFLLFDYLGNHLRLKQKAELSTTEVYFNAILNYIHKNYADNISISDIATANNIDRTYVFKLFQKYLKISPSQYLQQYRLSKACTLLRKTSLSITDISYTVGFQHAPYFTKLFTQYIGETPSEYRKEYMRFGEDSFS